MTDQDFIPDAEFKPDPTAAPAATPARAPSSDFIPDAQFVPDEQKYGSLGQEVLTGVEGAAKGVAGPVATLAERALTESGIPGLSPEEQAGREAANPLIHGVSEAGGLGLGMLTGTGEARVLDAAGETALKVAGLAGKNGFAAKVAAGALKGAVENATFQGGDEISRLINGGDPVEIAQTAIPHLGLSAAIGAAVGAPLGAVSALWKGMHEVPVGQAIQDFKSSADGTILDQEANAPVRDIKEAGFGNRLTQQKENASEIIDAADRNNWPLAEGMTSGSKEIQMAEDALLNGPPTLASIARRKVYQDALQAASKSVDSATAGADALSETQAGNLLKSSLSDKLSAEYEPIKQLYSEIEPYQSAIPVTDRTTGSLSRNIEKIIEEKGVVPGTERYNFLKSFADGIDSVDNLQKLKSFRTEVGRSSGPLTKDLAADVANKLDGVEERAIKRFADTMKTGEAKEKVLDLISKIEDAKSQYSEFRGQLQKLGKSLGKSKIYGPQDFIDFVDQMNPQQVARKLFNENNTEFSNYFAKSFPEEFSIMRAYQRGLIRQEATKDGLFSATKAIKNILDMEPEMKKLLFTENELQTIKDAKAYLASFPKQFNPSGTAHESAFRGFFEHPTGAAIANLRDFGIQGFIKAFGRATPGADREAGRILPLLGKAAMEKESNASAFKASVDYAMSVIRGEKMLDRTARSFFRAGGAIAGETVQSHPDTEKLDKKLKEYAENPHLYANIGGDLGHYLPNHDIGLKSTAANAINYLNSIRPVASKKSPLDPEVEPSNQQKEQFNRVLRIAENPLHVISLMKNGQLTAQDMAHFRSLYPQLYARLSHKLTDAMMNHVSKGIPVPYASRAGLSTFLGQPLDSTMISQSIASNQAVFGQPALQGSPQTPAKKSKPSSSGAKSLKVAQRMGLHPETEE